MILKTKERKRKKRKRKEKKKKEAGKLKNGKVREENNTSKSPKLGFMVPLSNLRAVDFPVSQYK